MQGWESHKSPLLLCSSDTHSTHNDANGVLWEDSPPGNKHHMEWIGSPSHSSAFQATRDPSVRGCPSIGILEHSPIAAHSRGGWSHTLLWGQTQGTAPDPNPTACGKAKWSHSRIRSRTAFSIKLREKLTCSCFTRLLPLPSPTASQPEQGGTVQPGTGGPALRS